MKRQEAIRVLTGRLRSSRVRHSAGFDSGQMQITMGFNAVYAPDHRIESCIWFYEDTMEARCYYSSLGAELCRKSRHIDALLRLLNFINARVFPSCRGSGYMLYSPHILYTPRIYLTADGCFDITITTIIPMTSSALLRWRHWTISRYAARNCWIGWLSRSTACCWAKRPRMVPSHTSKGSS